jgi:hypothetical protein
MRQGIDGFNRSAARDRARDLERCGHQLIRRGARGDRQEGDLQGLHVP